MIPIRNIYYMLSYAFKALQGAGYRRLAAEEFENTADLFAAILAKGITLQIKQGLGRSYIPRTESLSIPRGKIGLTDSIKGQTLQKKQLICSYDDFSVNSRMNQILKATAILLMSSDISRSRKMELRRLMPYLAEIEEADLFAVDWRFHFDRNNQTYRILMSICQLVVKGLLQSNGDGHIKMMDFLDEQRMCQLYEKFILAYYRREHPELIAKAAQISWQLDDGFDDLLPIMQTDIYLSDPSGRNILIIDAKYYEHITQALYNAPALHSGNLYQIFTYVKNKEAELAGTEHHVSGMLLYAKTDEELIPDNQYQMSGNRIFVRTLDLAEDFAGIRKQLDELVTECFAKIS